MSWLQQIKDKKRAKGKMSPSKKRKPFLAFSDGIDAEETLQTAPSRKRQVWEDMMSNVEALATETDENYVYNPNTHLFEVKAGKTNVESDPGKLGVDLVDETEEGADQDHDLFGMDMRKKGSYCNQYKDSKAECERNNCKYTEKVDKKTGRTKASCSLKKKKSPPKASRKSPPKFSPKPQKAPSKAGPSKPTPKSGSSKKRAKGKSACSLMRDAPEACVAADCVSYIGKHGHVCRSRSGKRTSPSVQAIEIAQAIASSKAVPILKPLPGVPMASQMRPISMATARVARR